MLLKLTTGIPSFLIWLRPSDSLLATVSSCHQQWIMNCDILRPHLCFSLHFTLYRLLKYSPIPAIRNVPSPRLPRSFSHSFPLSFVLQSFFSLRSPLSCTIHLANLIFGVDKASESRPVFSHTFVSISWSLISLLPSLPFSSAFLSFTVLIMKSGSSPSSVLVAFLGLRD